MNPREYFDSIDIDELNRLVDEKQEENLYLEFKTVNHPIYTDSNREFDKKNLSVCLSGFANSGGGIVIWGIKAKKNASGQDVATELTPIDQLTKFLNLLNKLEGQAIIPVITGVQHVKIHTGNDMGFIKSFIPASASAPHMALYADKHYYKRSGDSFYPCEHYDIVDMFSRRKSPILGLEIKVVQGRKNVNDYMYRVLVSITNSGKSLAKLPYLAMNTNHNYRPSDYGLDGNRTCGLKKVPSTTKYRFNYSGGTEIVIYPETTVDIDYLESSVPSGGLPASLHIDYLLAAENMENSYGQLKIDSETIFTEGS